MRILLALEHKQNRRLLSEWVGSNHEIDYLKNARGIESDFDLGIVDGPQMEYLLGAIQKRKQVEGPVFLPFLLVTSRQNIRYVTRHLWRTVDEIILSPIEKVEFSARIEILLRARRLSLETQRLAITDHLTGIFNRRHFLLMAERELARLKRSGTPGSLVMLDIDHFKKVNDTFGHPVGDRVIREIAAHIRANIREYDLFARYGGEEMVLLLPETPVAEAFRFADRLRKEISQLAIVADDGGKVHVTVSFGVAETSRSEALEGLIRIADEALYAAKRSGRNRVATAGFSSIPRQ